MDYQTTNVLIFTAIFLGVFGFTWFEAQDKCQRNGQKIPTGPESKPSSSYWTTYHKRTSHWMCNLGCYSDKDLSFKRMNNYSLNVPSPGLCQERCIKRTPSTFLFAIKNNLCICLNEPPKKPSSQLSNCKFCMVNSKFSPEPECNGKLPFRVFFSIVFQKDINLPASNCDKTNKCCEIHINRMNERENLNTRGRDFTFAFRKIWDLLKPPLWNKSSCIVFIRQTYTSFDQGDKLTDFDKSKISSCQQCLKTGCPFVDCNDSVDTVFCSKTTVPPHTSFNISLEGKPTVITYQSSYAATTMNQHKTKDINWKVTTHLNNYTATVELTMNKEDEDRSNEESHEDFIQIVIPVLAIVISACLMCVVIKLIRRKQNSRVKRSLESQKDFSSGRIIDKNLSSPQYAEIKNKTDEHCLEECTYDLADNSNLEEERFTCNTEEESHYDHLRDNVQNKNVEEDIYNHLQIESESSYSTFTLGIELKGIIDNPYGEADFQNDI
ncbi:uncharacterized protein LOC134271052 isoform X2 [Saccostrea cucullata]|uniref:uncharacterized protein LOC134271052 isoform X2 n=1 Tax=Saccostrea cuccullata TaxID=36930 RepID=UPI002ED545CF